MGMGYRGSYHMSVCLSLFLVYGMEMGYIDLIITANRLITTANDQG